MNYIFGSGLIGLLAKIILGPSWKIVPFYRSRFFSFNPALDDNFIISDDELEPFFKDLLKLVKINQFIYRRSWSVAGQLHSSYDQFLCADWLTKVFGNQVPPQCKPYLSDRMNLTIYEIRANELYNSLVNSMIDELKEASGLGQVTEIGDHYFVRNGIKEEFDNLVSTIPLNALLSLSNSKNDQLPSKDLHYLHIHTEHLDFEGANQTLVVDDIFPFFKVTNVAPNRYLFYFNQEIQDPGIYLMNIIKSFEILDGTAIREAIPLGQMPDLKNLEEVGIYCVGSYAQWDWCMDIGSCILRLLRYAARGHKPKQNKELQL